MNSLEINTNRGISNGVNCDIIIPVYNELGITKDCIDSILKNTDCPYRLIIIDNGSQPEVAVYLAGLKGVFHDFLLIRNEQNFGYVKAINQGIEQSASEFVCLLNNDTVVSEGWLSEMINVANDNVDLGIINPSSNTLAQTPAKGQTIESYSASLKLFKGKWGELGQCSGFCMLIKREVIEKVGILDENYEVGYFEEADYCRKAQKAGYRFARAKAAYVYHVERHTFDKRPDKEELFTKNRKLFESRWGKSLRVVCLISKPPKDTIDKDEIEQIILSSAQDNHRVYVFIKNKLVSRFNIAEHSNILIYGLHNIFFGFTCLFKIVAKKPKKRFNIILVDNLFFFYALKLFTVFHKARLMFSPHLERAIELSKKESFSACLRHHSKG